MKAKRVVALLVAALVVYFVLIGVRGIYLLGQHRVSLKVLGVAVLVLPLVGIWVVVAEIRFGLATERLGARLGRSGADSGADEPLARTSSGRIDRVAADARFETRAADVRERPDDWRAWFRLSLAYDDAGDRKRARSAMRAAIEHSARSGE